MRRAQSIPCIVWREVCIFFDFLFFLCNILFMEITLNVDGGQGSGDWSFGQMLHQGCWGKK